MAIKREHDYDQLTSSDEPAPKKAKSRIQGTKKPEEDKPLTMELEHRNMALRSARTIKSEKRAAFFVEALGVIDYVAHAAHDAPYDIRMMILKQYQGKEYDEIIHMISSIEIGQKSRDPLKIFHSVVTREILEGFAAKIKCEWTKIVCLICKQGFCTTEDGDDVEDVVWKQCNKHLMHRKCFIESVSELGKATSEDKENILTDELPLHGECSCIEPEGQIISID